MERRFSVDRRQFALGSGASLLVAGCSTMPGLGALEPVARAGENATPLFARLLAEAIASGQREILLPPGELHFWPEGTAEEFLYVSNNDDAINKIVARLDGARGLHIRGQGTRLIFHGPVTPFVARNAEGLTFSDLSIDWEKPFHSEGVVEAADPGGKWIDMTIRDGFDFAIRDGDFVFQGDGFETVGTKRLLEFDKDRRETAYGVWDLGFASRDSARRRPHSWEALGGRRVRMSTERKLRSVPQVGNVMLIMPRKRLSPAFFLEDCRETTFRNVTIHHAGAMGIIAQTCHDITLTGTGVYPSGDRFFSTVVDATHFVNCSGHLLVEGGKFRNHIDDAVNVHGIYVRVLGKTGPRTVRGEYSDFQQRGVRTMRVGDEVELANARTVNTYLKASVVAVEYEDERYVTVTLDRDLHDNVAEGDVINTLNRQTALTLRGNDIGNNRARGILISTGGTVLVEGNRFHAPGAAIRISGGVDHWYESGPTHDVTIRGNMFDHSLFGVWGEAIIDIVAVDAEAGVSSEPYHRKVVIDGNVFRTEHGKILKAYRVGELRFTGNVIEGAPYVGNFNPAEAPFDLTAIGSFVATDNVVSVFDWSANITPEGEG